MYKLPKLSKRYDLSKIAVLTSGGDSPGMNSAIRAVVRTAVKQGIAVMGIHRGYEGLISEDFESLKSRSVSNIIQDGGTLLKSARSPSFHKPEVRQKAAAILRKQGIDALVVIGGDGSLTGAHLLDTQEGVRVIGLPGTIDNDIYGCDDSIGFDTAVNTAVEAIDKIHDTSMSHDRHFLVEVMGRHCGLIAAQVGIASGAELVLVPENSLDIKDISQQLAENRKEGFSSSGIIVVAEGQAPNLTQRIAEQMRTLGEDPRVCILGHIQRGGAPSAHDRVLASTLGNMAVHYLLAGYHDVLVGVDTGKVCAVPLDQVIANSNKHLPPELLRMIEELER